MNEKTKAERGGYELILIPSGSFMMGSPESEKVRYLDEGLLHEVHVPAFYMGRYPVTNEEYARFLINNPEIEEPKYWADRKFNQSRQPVVGVSWNDAKRYAEWAGLFLPSESMWEYACRAGTQTRYYTGDEEKDLDRAGWYKENSKNHTHPVGEKEPNKFGLYDMHGNVWEWTEDDWHSRKNYTKAPNNGSAWIDTPRSAFRVIRGGSWNLDAQSCRSAICYDLSTDYRCDLLGFRLSRSVILDS